MIAELDPPLRMFYRRAFIDRRYGASLSPRDHSPPDVIGRGTTECRFVHDGRVFECRCRVEMVGTTPMLVLGTDVEGLPHGVYVELVALEVPGPPLTRQEQLLAAARHQRELLLGGYRHDR